MKNCSNKDCKQTNPQPLDGFYKNKTAKDAHNSKCKPCVIEARRIYREMYPEKVQVCKKASYEKHKDSHKEERDRYYEENRDSILEYKRTYYIENREDIIEHKTVHQRERTKNDPLFRLRRNLRRRASLAFKGLSKSKNTIALLGCSIEAALLHIESLFYTNSVTGESMNWDNYGKLWEIDHKDPMGLGSNKEEIEALCHYTN